MNRMFLFFSLMLGSWLSSQSIDSLLTAYNQKTVPYISVEELKENYDQFTVLDTRKKKEYEVSHLPDAKWVGESYKKSRIKNLDLNKPVVVYCTVGIRSENYGEDLLKVGFKAVFNLRGSIFLWKDTGFELYETDGNPTDRVHTYSKEWAKYLKTGEKVN